MSQLAPLFNPAVALDQEIEAVIGPIFNWIAGVVFTQVPIAGAQVELIVFWLVAAAIFCTVYFRFINFRGFWLGFRLLRGDFDDAARGVGEVSHFQALATALSGTVGLGNIAGVAVAISIGGPGATFWMIVAGILGMATKFCECTLGVKYRLIRPDGHVSGGAFYYLSLGIADRYPKLAPLGKVLAVFFAIACICGSVGAGNMFQANQTFAQFVGMTGGEQSPLAGWGWAFGLGMAALVGLVIVGGIKSIANVTSKLVPAMAVIYLSAALFVLAFELDRIPAMFGLIINGAFSPEGVAGGVIGVLIVGFRRAAFSNEAGIGSAAIAHAAVKTREPVTEGLVALWEPFIDTVVICTMTALVIIATGAYQTGSGMSGVAMTSTAFGSVLPWFPWVLTVAIFLFAYSTMIAWSYYGARAAAYLFGETRKVEMTYNVVFLSFTVIGCAMPLSSLINFSDAMIFLMAIPNVIGIYLLAPVVKEELAKFMAHIQSGEVKDNHGHR
ncbi:MAG: alanine:cation symporter family protein [Xanthomonadales bacterium]|jgi:AGCS family alanine or glycine:cation symporter|nr:alanine:cation symporter family protein [Xanthomonadales bacterium]